MSVQNVCKECPLGRCPWRAGDTKGFNPPVRRRCQQPLLKKLYIENVSLRAELSPAGQVHHTVEDEIWDKIKLGGSSE